MFRFAFLLTVCFVVTSGLAAEPTNWPRFRGADGLGISENSNLPDAFGPDQNVLWKTELPTGNSSPVVWDGKVFLTGYDGEKLETFCLDAKSGSIQWRVTSPLRTGKVPYVRRTNTPASPSPAVDKNVVCVYFDAFGLLAYDHDGKELWKKRLPKAKQPWGVGTSPIIADGRVFLNVDQDIDSYLIAIDAANGKEVWRTDRPDARRGFSTPVVSGDQLIVAGSLRVAAYGLADGKELWTVKGLPYQVSPSPVVVDETVFMAAWDLGYTGLDFDTFLNEYDANKSGTITQDEHNFAWDFPKFDRNKDKVVTREEFEELKDVFEASHDSLMAIRLGGAGDVTQSHIKWEATTSLPHIPTVLVYRGMVYTVRNGGILCCYDAASGKRHFQKRLPGGGNYYASPVAANGRVYFASEKGVVSVIAANNEYELLFSCEFDEKILATPAIVDDTMIIRSEGSVYALGK